MTQGKLIGFWLVAMLALGGVYAYTTWRATGDRCDCASCRLSRDNPNGSMNLAPSLTLGVPMPDLQGHWVTPEEKAPEFKDKVVLLDFWGTFCAPCIASIPSNNAIYEKFAPQGLVLAGVSTDSKIALGEFKKTVDVRYPLLASDAKTFGTYQIEFTPSTFLFDRSGKLIWKGVHLENQDGSINASFEKALTQALSASAPKKDDAEATKPAPELGSAMMPIDGEWLDGKAPELKGNVVLLDFWGTFCQPCIQAIPANNKLLKKHAAEGFVLVGAAPDTKAVLEDFKKTIEIGYPLLAATKKTFMDYGIEFLPTTFLYDRSGKLVWKGAQFEKPNGAVEETFEKALNEALKAK